MENSKIQWTTHTFNPWIGCTRVSPGCANCYAETLMDTRYGRVRWGKGQARSRTSAVYWKQPHRWNREAVRNGERFRVFPSLCDPFDNEVPEAWRGDFFRLIETTPALNWLLLSKRADDMLAMMAGRKLLDNLWLGVSVENQLWADRRLRAFRDVPAAVHFVSYEPAIGPVTWEGWEFINWLIIGGESGKGARYFDSAWAHTTLDWCRFEGVACFMKQKGSNSDIPTKDSKGGNIHEWPAWCQVREFPDRPRLILT